MNNSPLTRLLIPGSWNTTLRILRTVQYRASDMKWDDITAD